MAQLDAPNLGGERPDSIATKDCPRKDVRVFVNGTEIPTIDEGVRTEVGKDGPASINRFSEVTFPAIWDGERVVDYVEAFAESGIDVPVRIEFRHPQSENDDDFETVHYGYLRQYGSGGRGRRLRFKVADLNHLFKTPFGARYEGPSVRDVIEDVRDHVLDEITFLNELPIRGTSLSRETLGFTEEDDPIDAFRGFYRRIYGFELLDPSQPVDGNLIKEFRTNRDTAATVLDWITRKADLEWWIDYDPDHGGPVLVVDDSPATLGQHYVDGHTDADGVEVTVRHNMALADLNPYNQVSVFGDSPMSVFGFSPSRGNVAGDEFPYAVARHTELYNRANQTAISTRIQKDDSTTVAQVENVAKQKLKDVLAGDVGGSVKFDGQPSMTPYCSFEGVPVCEDLVADVPPMRFEMGSVTHQCKANERYQTSADVSVYAADEKIEIVESGVKKVN